MVYNERRKGWEMPGGKIEKYETVRTAAEREFTEESGYDVEILDVLDTGECYVCAGILSDKASEDFEMQSALFSEIPPDICFDRSEYDAVIPWARTVAERNKKE